MTLRTACMLALLAAALVGSNAFTGEAPSRYEQIKPSRDGIGKRYMGREIAQVMGWQAASWLERAEREQEERTSVLLDELRLAPGMVVADVGAGSGYLTRRLAPRIAPGGRVIAQDLQPEMLALLVQLAKDSGLGNIETVQGTVDDTRLPADSVDLAIMVDVYHELEYPYEILESLVRAESPDVPIKPLHRMSERQIRREAGAHALQWERTSRRLPWQHLVVFRKVAP